jgi:hypothetical protein
MPATSRNPGMHEEWVLIPTGLLTLPPQDAGNFRLVMLVITSVRGRRYVRIFKLR